MKLSNQNMENQEQQYDLLAHKFNELYLTGKERGREAMTVALKKSHEQLTVLGAFSAEQRRSIEAIP